MSQPSLPEPPGFAELPKAAQIEYLQALWDRISHRPEDLPVPASHVELAEARLKDHERSPGAATSAYGILDRLATRKR